MAGLVSGHTCELLQQQHSVIQQRRALSRPPHAPALLECSREARSHGPGDSDEQRSAWLPPCLLEDYPPEGGTMLETMSRRQMQLHPALRSRLVQHCTTGKWVLVRGADTCW